MKKSHLWVILSSIIMAVALIGCSDSDSSCESSAYLKRLGKEAGILIEGHFAPNGSLYNLNNNCCKRLAGCNFNVTDLRGVDVDGFKKLQLTLGNKQNKNIDVQYRISWFDASGMEIDPNKSHWRTIELYSKEMKTITAVAPTTEAYSFRLYVRDMQFKKIL